MNDTNRKWFYLGILALIWGTSYILIKKGLEGFTPLQLGSVRIVIATSILLIFGWRSIKNLTSNQWKWIAISGIFGSFFPVYLFSYAETEIDSSIASVLNSLVPLFTIFVGYLAFRVAFTGRQVVGVFVGLIGAVLLIIFGSEINPGQNYWYAGLVIVATIFYAYNANIIKTKLHDVSPLGITVGNFVVMVMPAIVILIFSGIHQAEVTEGAYFYSSLGYIVLLSIMSTCVAKVMFNRLIHISTPVFSVSVTYLIPIVGILWGLLDGEKFTLLQLLASSVILLGVYLVNRSKRNKS